MPTFKNVFRTCRQGPRSYFESGGAKNTFFLVTLYNFLKRGRATALPSPPPPRSLVGVLHTLTLEPLRGGGSNWPPPRFFGFKFLLLDRLSKALAQLFLVCEHIFWHQLSDVIGDDVIAKSHAICVLTAKSQFFARNLLNTQNFTMDSTYLVDFNS